MQPLRIFIGFDPRQVISYSTLCASIAAHATKPVAITPLILNTLPIERAGLTPPTYSRFLVPWLCDFEGWALYLDADMVFYGDVAELFDLADDKHAVMVRETPAELFERAAVMLFNCGHADNLRLHSEVIAQTSIAAWNSEGVTWIGPDQDIGTAGIGEVAGKYECKTPHLIDWTDAIGELPSEWGHLVGYNEPRDDAKLVHFTQGVPAWPETFKCEHAEEWLRMANISVWPWAMKEVEAQCQWADLMGESVHAKTLEDGRVVPKLYDPEQDAA